MGKEARIKKPSKGKSTTPYLRQDKVRSIKNQIKMCISAAGERQAMFVFFPDSFPELKEAVKNLVYEEGYQDYVFLPPMTRDDVLMEIVDSHPDLSKRILRYRPEAIIMRIIPPSMVKEKERQKDYLVRTDND